MIATTHLALGATLTGVNIQELRTAHSPRQNAYAERLIGSIRRECLDHVILAAAVKNRTEVRPHREPTPNHLDTSMSMRSLSLRRTVVDSTRGGESLSIGESTADAFQQHRIPHACGRCRIH